MDKRLTLVLIVTINIIFLASCDISDGPAPFIDRSYGERKSPSFSETNFHLVKKGETIFEISQRYNLPTRTLIERNNLNAPFFLEEGTRLYIPNTRIHKVRPGETLHSIAINHGVSNTALARANNIKSPFTIYAGQRLKLPFGINKYINNNINGKISISGTETPLSKPTPNSKITNSIKRSGSFIWPVEGRLLSSFGIKEGSALHNDGLNIAAPMGAAVRAADNGIVAYAGNQIRGFGNMLLIKHSDGFITAYAHTEKLLVSRGDIVSKGQVIARVGKSGGIGVPQLHFEVRKGSLAVDPLRFLPG
jgi:murein DD-endopeptidase MepM/ murein hydrolase activator NlpD